MSNIFSFEAKKAKSDEEKQEDYCWTILEKYDIRLTNGITIRILRNNEFLINYNGTETIAPSTDMEVALALNLYNKQNKLDKAINDIKHLKIRLAKLFLVKSKFSRIKFKHL